MLMSVPGGNSGFEVVEGCQARRILNLLLIHNLEKYGEATTSKGPLSLGALKK